MKTGVAAAAMLGRMLLSRRGRGKTAAQHGGSTISIELAPVRTATRRQIHKKRSYGS